MSNSDETIKPGDLVELKSGGPVMTASQVHNEIARCEWFISNERKWGDFRVVALRKVDPAKLK